MERMTIHYALPEHWLKYDRNEVMPELIEAKAAVLALKAMPSQRAWAEKLQEIELKREVAGTSRIEGADFTEREFEEAVASSPPEGPLTRSQKQARAAMQTYRWIASLAVDRPITDELIKEIHRRIVTGCDDDHCPPGQLRGGDQNVTFGRPRHRGASGGRDCATAFRQLLTAVNQEFRDHDPLIQALAFHYHLGAIHPFLDGNGRTARACEALLLQRAGLKDTLFVSMSNYYYDEKDIYLSILSHAGENRHDITTFLRFGLDGIASQCNRLLREINRHISISLFRDVVATMYNSLLSPKKRALKARQTAIINHLLSRNDPYSYDKLYSVSASDYSSLENPKRAFFRDIIHLKTLGAIRIEEHPNGLYISPRLEWATEITETQFFKLINQMPAARSKLLRS